MKISYQETKQDKNNNFKNRKNLFLIEIVGCIICVIIIFFVSTYAADSKLNLQKLLGKTLRIDETAYGNTVFDANQLNLRPILDEEVSENNNQIIYIPFMVGGAKENNTENIIYDIALVDLEIDCNLLSPYLKWKLLKNGEEISNGSFDYHFDTIVNKRLVLTNIQQDLPLYNTDKTTYDRYEFYIWLSDSCQSNDLSECTESEEQSFLMNKKLKGKIEVELLSGLKQELVRFPANELDMSTCLNEGGAEYE